MLLHPAAAELLHNRTAGTCPSCLPKCTNLGALTLVLLKCKPHPQLNWRPWAAASKLALGLTPTQLNKLQSALLPDSCGLRKHLVLAASAAPAKQAAAYSNHHGNSCCSHAGGFALLHCSCCLHAPLCRRCCSCCHHNAAHITHCRCSCCCA